MKMTVRTIPIEPVDRNTTNADAAETRRRR
jgi:hypothetical protein